MTKTTIQLGNASNVSEDGETTSYARTTINPQTGGTMTAIGKAPANRQPPINPSEDFAGQTFADHVLPTALSPDGSRRDSNVNDDSIVSVLGVQGRLGDFVSAGEIVKSEGGMYKLAGEGNGRSVKPKAEKQAEVTTPDHQTTAIAERGGLEGFGAGLLMEASSVILQGGSVDDIPGGIISDMAASSGKSEEEVRNAADTAFKQIWSEASSIVSGYGVDAEQVFSDPANLSAISAAARRHVNVGDASGYKAIAIDALSNEIKADPAAFVEKHQALGHDVTLSSDGDVVLVDVDGDMNLIDALRMNLVRFR